MTNATRSPASIADLISAECAALMGANQTRDDAKEALDSAKDGALKVREGLMVSLAGLSHQHAWTKDEIAAAVKLVLARNNDKTKEKTLETLGGEIKNAAAPNVRQHTKALVELANACWLREEEAKAIDKDTPTPIRKAFSRRYHVITGLFKLAADGQLITTADDLIAEATRRDPDMDPDKVFKRLTKIAEDLAAIYRVFKDDDIKVAGDTISEIKKADLKKLIAPATTVVDTAKPNAAPVPQLKVVPQTTAPSPAETEPAGGVVDIDDLLAGHAQTTTTLQQAAA